MIVASIVFALILIYGLIVLFDPDKRIENYFSQEVYGFVMVSAFVGIMGGGVGTIGHHCEWYNMAFEYRAYKSDGEVLQTTINHARAENLDWETATMTTKLVEYNTKLADLKLANIHTLVSKHYIDDRVMDLPLLK